VPEPSSPDESDRMPSTPGPAITEVDTAADQALQLMGGITTANSPKDALEQVLAVLDVQPDGQTRADVFLGTSYRPPWGRIFGGQVLAQSLMAAARTVDPARPVHSLHAYFLRAGDPDAPISFEVERLRDGRSFSARRTQAIQRGKPILSMISSFQQPVDGLDHQLEMPAVPGPDELPTLEDLFGHLKIPSLQHLLASRPIDMRHVDGPLYLEPGPEPVAHQAVWLRAAGAMPDDALLHTALLAYASDYTLLESVVRRHGLSWANAGMKTASLDHAMWFHRWARADEWLLYVQESPSASGARGLGLGRIFTADGMLVASTAQEGMMRLPRRD
jgi:acyl-CoA thioesterase II